ncbi:hypothetical protein GPECTOR_4g1009 [Gonium pectorale]|uniref:Uncharacterized protein n=1 Tax=Gonium pectorale TaxID=33097 RepID=A0A150GXQ2_GONPE|nr:hypothetical protein GPECTOR_4g1009 [Gonium pectorale]|eukprot:KXZ54458.1 hypothetical protein GPECTOR_4g1009 [Gonium pectorale]
MGHATRVQLAAPGTPATSDPEAAGGPWGTAVDDLVCACDSADELELDGDGADGDGAVAECILVGAHVELGGSASSVDAADIAVQPAVCHHNGRTYLSVRNLPPTVIITLGAGAVISHPVNVTPPEHSA